MSGTRYDERGNCMHTDYCMKLQAVTRLVKLPSNDGVGGLRVLISAFGGERTPSLSDYRTSSSDTIHIDSNRTFWTTSTEAIANSHGALGGFPTIHLQRSCFTSQRGPFCQSELKK